MQLERAAVIHFGYRPHRESRACYETDPPLMAQGESEQRADAPYACIINLACLADAGLANGESRESPSELHELNTLKYDPQRLAGNGSRFQEQSGVPNGVTPKGKRVIARPECGRIGGFIQRGS